MNTQTPEQQEKKGQKPTHILYARSYINGSQVNVKIGAAWKHGKGEGMNIAFESLVLFPNTPKEQLSKIN